MKAVLFIYKREDTVMVLDLEWSLKRHKELISSGYEHISTIDAAIVLQNIVNILDGSCSDSAKIMMINAIITE